MRVQGLQTIWQGLTWTPSWCTKQHKSGVQPASQLKTTSLPGTCSRAAHQAVCQFKQPVVPPDSARVVGVIVSRLVLDLSIQLLHAATCRGSPGIGHP